VIFIRQAVNATLNAGGNILAGRDITAKIWGHSFMGIAIECTISQYGDRNFPYYLLDYDEKTMAFRVKHCRSTFFSGKKY
jgi:hypothetical protein